MLILPRATPAFISHMEWSSWQYRRSPFAAENVIGGNLDQDGLDAIASISVARRVTRQIKERAVPPLWRCHMPSGWLLEARPNC